MYGSIPAKTDIFENILHIRRISVGWRCPLFINMGAAGGQLYLHTTSSEQRSRCDL